MDFGLNGKRALVTGASRGLGRAIASALRAEGAQVAICARDEKRVQATAREIGALGFARDLTPRGAGVALAEEVSLRLGGIDILVVNTGGPPTGTFEAQGDAAWAEAFEGIFMSAVGLIRASLSGMRERKWGRIIIVTSIAGKEPAPGLVLSNAIRPALHGLTNALSREVAADGITVNAILPGYTLTERLLELGVDERKLADQIPAKRVGKAEEFAALAAFLASEPAAYICGQAIACDGGFLQSI